MTALHSTSFLHKPSQHAYETLGLLAVWWVVIACFVTALDLVSSRAAYVPLYIRAIEHYWDVPLYTGLIGALQAERNRLLWFAISALGGFAVLCIMVAAVTLLGGLLGE